MRKKQVILFICFTATLSVACGNLTSHLSSSSTGNGPAVASTGNPREDLIKWMTGQQGAKSFRAHSVSTSTQGESTKDIEFVAPDRYHFTSTRENGRQQEIIIVGSKSYVKSGDRPWQQFPGDAGGFLTSLRDPQTVDYLRKSTDIKLIGTDTLEGAPMWVYEYTFQFDKSGSSEAAHKSKVWVATTDGLPRRVDTKSEISGVASKMTTTYTDYNREIKIEPPM
jgi:outer membrane lipoprotein-sorting protein